jgi:Acetyltransferase (GNAT) domain
VSEEGDLGKGYGTRMMQLALERCFANVMVKAVLVDPLAINTRAHRFYERLGFRPMERRMFGNDDCIVYRLERRAWHALTAIGGDQIENVCRASNAPQEKRQAADHDADTANNPQHPVTRGLR